MLMNVKKFMEDSGLDPKKVYPGRRTVKACPQKGEKKGHCVEIDWRDPNVLSFRVKPGLTGRELPADLIKKYPVCFQTPTYINVGFNPDEIEEDAVNDDEEDEEEGTTSSGKGGGGKGVKKAKKKDKDASSLKMMGEFARVIEGAIPELGKIKEMVVMGMKISEQAYERVIDTLSHQISKGKITATDLLAEAGKFVTRYTPPSFLKPKGNEDAEYTYDREKVEPMFNISGP